MRYIRDNLAVCGFDAIGNRADFASHGFGAQLQCTDFFDPWLPECVDVLCAPFADGVGIPRNVFDRAQGWLANHWDAGSKILISCAAGQSRSVTMAIALVSAKARVSFLHAALDVVRRVPGTYPHPHVLASAAAYSGKPLRLEELQSVYAAARWQPPYPWSPDLVREAADTAYA